MSLESFRPESLDGVVGQVEVVQILTGIVRSYQTGNVVPNLMFYGPPGTGKTTTALALTKTLLGDGWRDDFKEVNASDDRGVVFLREHVKAWAFQKPGYGHRFKVLLIDEADGLTHDAQEALRRLIETSSTNTRFVFSCNNVNKLTAALQSRCVRLPFRPLSEDDLSLIVYRAANVEHLSPDGARVLDCVQRAKGDARVAIQRFLHGGADHDGVHAMLDAEMVAMFRSIGPIIPRIERFIAFLRTEGLSNTREDVEQILIRIADRVVMTDDLVGDAVRKRRIMAGANRIVDQCWDVADAQFQLRSWLYEVIND